MEFEISATVKLTTGEHPQILRDVLQPENKTPNNTRIISTVKDNLVVTEIHGKMKVRTLLNSIDDILQTAILSQNVSETINQAETQDHQE